MAHYADPDRCPDCGAPLPPAPGRSTCPACGLTLSGPAAVELFTTLQRADALLASLRAGPPDVVAPASDQPAPPDYAPPERSVVAVPPLAAPVHQPHRWSVPVVLLSLGGLCLVVGALVFLAVTWSVLGVGGRTAVLVALTGVAAVGTVLSARRGLRAAAETFATVTALFLALDLAGAANAGWLGDLGTSSAVLLSAVVVAVASALGNAAVRRLPTGPLVAPQLVATGATLVAAGAALDRFGDHPLVTMSVSIVIAALAAFGAHHAGQRVLGVGETVVAALLWLLVVATGLGQSVDAWATDGRGAASWSDVEPLLVAAAFAAAVVLAVRLLRAPGVTDGLAAVAACWLVPAAVAAVVGETVTELVLVALAAAVLVVALALLVRPLVRAFGLAAIGLAGAGALAALSAVVVLAAGVGDELEHQLSSSAPDLLARADLASFDGDVAAPWTLPLAALAVAAAVTVTLVGALRLPAGAWRPALAVGGPVVVASALCYLPLLLLVVLAAVAFAAQHLPARLRPWSLDVGVPLALGWTVLAGVVALYDPAVATGVALLTTVVVTGYVVRTGSIAGQGALPPLVALTVASAGWLLDCPGPWTVAAMIVAVAVVTVAVGTHYAIHLAALATCLVVLPIGVESATAHEATWLAAYLTLTAVGAAVVSIKERSIAAAWAAALLELGATWVRLDASGVSTPEAYTLPLAAVLLAFGGWALWHDRSRGSLRTLGPGLVAALLPSLVVTAGDPVSLRALLLALACGALVAVGAVGRLLAPLVCGALAGAALVVLEVLPFHDAVPRWVLLTVAGVCLVVAGVRWEHLATLGRRGWGRLSELT